MTTWQIKIFKKFQNGFLWGEEVRGAGMGRARKFSFLFCNLYGLFFFFFNFVHITSFKKKKSGEPFIHWAVIL